MDFSSLQKAVRDLWEFLWPPVINIILLGLTTRFLAPETLSQFAKHPYWSQLSSFRSMTFYKVLKRFELIKLIPLVVTFFVILLLYLAQNAIHGIGDLLPGHIVYRSDLLLIHTSNPDELVSLWGRFPNTSEINDLALAVDQKLAVLRSSEKQPALSSVRYWEDEFGKAVQRFSVVKFFIFWSFLCASAEAILRKRVGRSLFRFLVCAFILTAVGILYFGKQVYALEQQGFAKTRAAQVLIVMDTTSPKPIPESTPSIFDEKIKSWDRLHFQSRDDWWEFRVFDVYYLTWLRRTFLRRPSSPV